MNGFTSNNMDPSSSFSLDAARIIAILFTQRREYELFVSTNDLLPWQAEDLLNASLTLTESIFNHQALYEYERTNLRRLARCYRDFQEEAPGHGVRVVDTITRVQLASSIILALSVRSLPTTPYEAVRQSDLRLLWALRFQYIHRSLGIIHDFALLELPSDQTVGPRSEAQVTSPPAPRQPNDIFGQAVHRPDVHTFNRNSRVRRAVRLRLLPRLAVPPRRREPPPPPPPHPPVHWLDQIEELSDSPQSSPPASPLANPVFSASVSPISWTDLADLSDSQPASPVSSLAVSPLFSPPTSPFIFPATSSPSTSPIVSPSSPAASFSPSRSPSGSPSHHAPSSSSHPTVSSSITPSSTVPPSASTPPSSASNTTHDAWAYLSLATNPDDLPPIPEPPAGANTISLPVYYLAPAYRSLGLTDEEIRQLEQEDEQRYRDNYSD